MTRICIPFAILAAAAASAPSFAQQQPEHRHVTPIADALEAVGEDVRVFDQHVTTLANPFMEGRLPGTRGMQIAKEYCEHYLRQAGVEPGFLTEEGQPTWRQPFPLGGTIEVSVAELEFRCGEETHRLVAGTQFNVLGLGGSGQVSGDIVFVGYGIESGPDDYAGWKEGLDLTGKVALAFRFEPMHETGKSKWSERSWTRESSWNRKLRDLADLNPAAVLFVNPPGVDDPRGTELVAAGKGGRRATSVPVMMLDRASAERLMTAAGTSLQSLRVAADQAGVVKELPIVAKLNAEIGRKTLIAENVGGILRGRGALANEVVVMGAHLDHLGMGEFGSRSGGGALHPGADDNASGSAAVLMLAERLKARYAAMPADASARTLLFVLFSGEESGLNGSQFYVNHPIRPLEEHALMCNFDMIGRIKDGKLSVSGGNSATGMHDWLQPIFARSPLEIVQPSSIMAASDHAAFYNKKVPVLFAIITPFHGDYHTPRDVSWRINRVGGAQTVDLFEDILITASTRPERFEFQTVGRQRRDRPQATAESGAESRPQPPAVAPAVAPAAQSERGAISVRFGIMPSGYEDTAPGIGVGSVSTGSPAEDGGIKDGDRLMTWDGAEIKDVGVWMGMLAKHKPGDVVEVGVDRDGQRVALKVTLVGKEEGGR